MKTNAAIRMSALSVKSVNHILGQFPTTKGHYRLIKANQCQPRSFLPNFSFVVIATSIQRLKAVDPVSLGLPNPSSPWPPDFQIRLKAIRAMSGHDRSFGVSWSQNGLGAPKSLWTYSRHQETPLPLKKHLSHRRGTELDDFWFLPPVFFSLDVQKPLSRPLSRLSIQKRFFLNPFCHNHSPQDCHVISKVMSKTIAIHYV